MAENGTVTKPFLKTFSLDSNLSFLAQMKTNHDDLEHNDNHRDVLKQMSKKRTNIPVQKLQEERWERSEDLEEAWSKVQIAVDRESSSAQTDDFIPGWLSQEPLPQDASTQTDPFVEESLAEISETLDKETQLFADELFDFEREVEPILDDLVSPIIEGALLEVLEEEEQQNQATSIQQRLAWFKDKAHLPSPSSGEIGEFQRNSHPERANDELMISVLANDYVNDVLSLVHGGTACQKEEPVIEHANADYVESFLPWFVRRIDLELGKLQICNDALASFL